MIHSALIGARALGRGLGLLNTPGLRRFVAMPLAINVVLFSAAIGAGIHGFDLLMDWLLDKLPGWLDWLRYLLWPLFAVTVLVVVFYGFTLLANLVAAPFNGLLAEAVEKHLRGQPLPDAGGWRELLLDVIPSLWSELRKLAYFMLWLLPFFLLLWVPVIGQLCWLLFSAWMIGLEYMDYPLGNQRMRFPAQRAMLRKQRGMTLGFGGVALAMTLVPVLNFVAMPAAVAGATVLWVERLDADAN